MTGFPTAESMITGILRSRGSVFRLWYMDAPPVPGIITSRTIRSGACSRALARAADPSRQASVRYPLVLNNAEIKTRMSMASSTIRMVAAGESALSVSGIVILL